MIGSGHAPGIRTATLASLAGAAPRRAWLLDQHLLLFATAGHSRHVVDFAAYPCRPGTLLWARPGQAVRYAGAPGLDAVLLSWPAGLLPALPWTDDPFGPTCWQLAGEDEDAVIDQVSQLVVDCTRTSPSELGQAMLRHQLAALLLRVAQVAPVTPVPGTAVPMFARFRREVETGYPHCRQVTVYAHRLGCSVRTLTRACLDVTGRTAKQLIDDRVTLEARRLLATTELSVAEIAGRLGFPEPTHFGRLFQRAVGISPGGYRERDRAGD